MFEDLKRSFQETFHHPARYIFSAPGRTEIGGNHTDHQLGRVLAGAVSVDTLAAVAENGDRVIRILSQGYPLCRIDLDSLEVHPEESGKTPALIRGVAAGIAGEGFPLCGFDAYVTSRVLPGSGLSSSAAFEVLIGTILNHLCGCGLDAVRIAQLGQFAENVYFGKPCGLMDQMACSVGALCHMDFADPANPVIEKIDYDFGAAGFSLCITDTKGSHADLTPDYAAVPAEMCSVAKALGKNVLREVPEELFLSSLPSLREKLGDRPLLRAMHFYQENRRVREEASSLLSGDLENFLLAVQASGDSSFKYLQNVYTSRDVLHQNVSLALCLSEYTLRKTASERGDLPEGLSRIGVARVHGGGFAGTIQAFVPDASVSAYQKAMDDVFGEGACMVLKIRKYGGIRVTA